jgi:3-hydroxyacyl-[acyl-carrier-protein] dehydratase
VDTDVDHLLRQARRARIVPEDAGSGTVVTRAAVEGALPHRGASLLIDEVTHHDAAQATIVARYAIDGAQLDGHFPGDPIWPGVMQVEAIGQAGALVAALEPGSETAGGPPILTEIAGAHFLHPVRPGPPVDIAARVYEDGLFFLIVGQCLQAGRICSVAAVRGMRGA